MTLFIHIEINVNTRVDDMHANNIYMYIHINVAEFMRSSLGTTHPKR